MGVLRHAEVLRERVVIATEDEGWVADGSCWRESLVYLIWPAFKRAFENRRTVPERLARHPHLRVHRLGSDRDVREFVRSVQAEA